MLDDKYFTKISNETIETLAKTALNGTQRRILDVLFRYTNGYHRKEFDLSLTFIAEATNIHKKQVQRELNALIQKNIVIVTFEGSFTKPRILSFNTNFNEWIIKEGANTIPPIESDVNAGSKLDTSCGIELDTQIKKKENTKESNALVEKLFAELWELYPNQKGKSAVLKKNKQKIFTIGKELMVVAIENYKSELQRETWKKIMNGNTFFNGRYKDYLNSGGQLQQESEIYLTNTQIEEYLNKSYE